MKFLHFTIILTLCFCIHTSFAQKLRWKHVESNHTRYYFDSDCETQDTISQNDTLVYCHEGYLVKEVNNELPTGWISDVVQINDSTYLVLTGNQGLLKYTNSSITRIDTLNNPNPQPWLNCLLVKSETDLYVAGESGIQHYDGNSWETQSTNSSIVDMAWYNSTEIIAVPFSIFKSFLRYDGTNWLTEISNYDFGWLDVVPRLFKYSANELYMFALDENYELTKFNDGIWETFHTSNSEIPTNKIRGVAKDTLGVLYLASGDSGLISFDGNNWISNNVENSGIPNNSLQRGLIKGSNDKLYMTTSQFFIEYDGNTWKSFVLPYFQNDTKMSSSSNDEIFLSSKSGWLTFYPDVDITTHEINGQVYHDLNENSTFDLEEPTLSNQRIQLASGNLVTFSDAQGKFHFDSNPGEYTLEIIPPPFWHGSNGVTTQTVNTSEINSSSVQFGLKKDADTVILSSLLTTSRPRCGFEVSSQFEYANRGNTTEDVVLSLELDSRISISNSITIPDSSSTNGEVVYWSKEQLNPQHTNSLKITLQMPGVEHIGDTLRSYATISTLDGSYSHTDTLESVLTCAYDPNDKLVKPLGIEEDHLTLFGDDLTYTVRFQNTGNDTAFTVVVKDTIDFNLDMNTFEVLASSHEVYTLFDLEGNVSFTFNDILLPDSNVNELESHGFVSFKISPKAGLEEYTEINNTAYIFFDFNPAIVTNETWNTMVLSLTVSAIEEDIRIINSSSAAPNPFSEATTIHFDNPSNTNHSLELFDVTGKIIKSISDISGSEIELNRNKLRTGLYFYSITENTSGEVFTGKLVVE